jgi:hypothetical protein
MNLVRFWADYKNSWNRKDPQSGAPDDAPPLPIENPKQAIHNRRNGSRWFMALQKSFPGRKTQKNADKSVANAHASEAAIEKPEDQDDHKVIAPIPKNIPGDQPIKPEKSTSRLIPETELFFDQQQPAMTPSDTPMRKRETSSNPDSTEHPIQ